MVLVFLIYGFSFFVLALEILIDPEKRVIFRITSEGQANVFF